MGISLSSQYFFVFSFLRNKTNLNVGTYMSISFSCIDVVDSKRRYPDSLMG